MKRFYISAWASIEAFQYGRPPAVIITAIAKSAGQVQAAVKGCKSAARFDVFDCSEVPVECEATCTLEEFKERSFYYDNVKSCAAGQRFSTVR